MRLDSKPWFFIALVTIAIGISYFDRQALPVAISAIQRNIPISDAQFALLQATFLATYALLYAGGGLGALRRRLIHRPIDPKSAASA